MLRQTDKCTQTERRTDAQTDGCTTLRKGTATHTYCSPFLSTLSAYQTSQHTTQQITLVKHIQQITLCTVSTCKYAYVPVHVRAVRTLWAMMPGLCSVGCLFTSSTSPLIRWRYTLLPGWVPGGGGGSEGEKGG